MPKKLVVAAIDLGSHGSGYAYSFMHDFEANPINVFSPLWAPDGGGESTIKTPSAMVLDSKKKFVAFGHEAEDKYTTICENNDQNSWYYLHGFKMKLYKAVRDKKVSILILLYTCSS